MHNVCACGKHIHPMDTQCDKCEEGSTREKAAPVTEGDALDDLVQSAYDAACKLCDRYNAVVEFTAGGMTYRVKPHRLGRKIADLEEKLRAATRRPEGGEVLDVMHSDKKLVLGKYDYQCGFLDALKTAKEILNNLCAITRE